MHFLNLPLEIRQLILQTAFSLEPLTVHESPHRRRYQTVESNDSGKTRQTFELPKNKKLQLVGWPLNILRVCRQIYREIERDYISWSTLDLLAAADQDRICCHTRTSVQLLNSMPLWHVAQMRRLTCSAGQPIKRDNEYEHPQYALFLDIKSNVLNSVDGIQKDKALNPTGPRLDVPVCPLQWVEIIDTTGILKCLGSPLSKAWETYVMAYEKGLDFDEAVWMYSPMLQSRLLRGFWKAIWRTHELGAQVSLVSRKQIPDPRKVVFEDSKTIVVHGIASGSDDRATKLLFAALDLRDKGVKLSFT